MAASYAPDDSGDGDTAMRREREVRTSSGLRFRPRVRPSDRPPQEVGAAAERDVRRPRIEIRPLRTETHRGRIRRQGSRRLTRAGDERMRAARGRDCRSARVVDHRATADERAPRLAQRSRERREPLDQIRMAPQFFDGGIGRPTIGRTRVCTEQPRFERGRQPVRAQRVDSSRPGSGRRGSSSRGNPNTRSPRMLRCTSLVPPPIVRARE